MIEKHDNEDYSIPEFLLAEIGPEYPEDAFCDALEMYIKHHRVGYI